MYTQTRRRVEKEFVFVQVYICDNNPHVPQTKRIKSQSFRNTLTSTKNEGANFGCMYLYVHTYEI